MVLLAGFSILLYTRTADRALRGASLFMTAAGACGLCNYALVAGLEPLGARYLMYTENLQAPALCVLLLALLPRRR